MKKKKQKNSAQRRIYFYFILSTAAALLVALLTATALEFLFTRLDIISLTPLQDKGWYWILIFTFTSIIIGLILASLLSKFMFRPINTVMDGMERLAEGEFSTRIDLGKYEGMQSLARSFNTLATELENTKILREDFVNDFSHELKTPVVSLVGLIGLMKNETLPEAKRRHYLDVCESEANRLRNMTESTLYLSRLESQSILTDRTKFNLSEQIRECVLLLQRKWSAKSLSLSLDFDEHYTVGNEDMLKQVFINLIDNAVKFATDKSELKIELEALTDTEAGAGHNPPPLRISVTNEGEEIPAGERDAIFQKFYQCDSSRSTEGNGIGLSIVKRIVALHNGTVTVTCNEGKTTFTVTLP
ncbi:MAG: HAMP domain-containing histidine kinase [Clostridia bacterium]|nr:HAMP domain-containing histidine kinase [Clostridia bacterium]